jgi:hypothetical protein
MFFSFPQPKNAKSLAFFSPAKKREAKASLCFCPGTGAFSNQFLEGMKLLYELEPFIKVKPYLTNQWEKSDNLGRVVN